MDGPVWSVLIEMPDGLSFAVRMAAFACRGGIRFLAIPAAKSAAGFSSAVTGTVWEIGLRAASAR